MFMFRSRKSNLVKRAWKARKAGLVELGNDRLLQKAQKHAEQYLKGAAMQLLRHLTESQLELLVTALESGGSDPGECVLLPRNVQTENCFPKDNSRVDRIMMSPERITLSRESSKGFLYSDEDESSISNCPNPSSSNLNSPTTPTPPPHLLMMWIWRWPDLFHTHQQQQQQQHYHLDQQQQDFQCHLIQNLPYCSAKNDHFYVCANPYHWGRRLIAESPPPPYSRFNLDLLRPEDAAPSEDECIESQETGGTYQYGSYSNHGPGTIPWCQIAYWEGRLRVGRLYPVRTPSLNIMGDIPHGDGLCLTSLTNGPDYRPSEQARKTKAKIGLGLVLYREGGSVWVYNRANIPIFINSPTIEGEIHLRYNFTVHKLPPGHIINIFDYDKARLNQKLPLHPELRHEGPIDRNSVRLSFAKGWGRNYHRQEITECPCWIEILLVPVR